MPVSRFLIEAFMPWHTFKNLYRIYYHYSPLKYLSTRLTQFTQFRSSMLPQEHATTHPQTANFLSRLASRRRPPFFNKVIDIRPPFFPRVVRPPPQRCSNKPQNHPKSHPKTCHVNHQRRHIEGEKNVASSSPDSDGSRIPNSIRHAHVPNPG